MAENEKHLSQGLSEINISNSLGHVLPGRQEIVHRVIELKGSQADSSFCPAVHNSLSFSVFLVFLPVIGNGEGYVILISPGLLARLSSVQEGRSPDVSSLHGWSSTSKHTRILSVNGQMEDGGEVIPHLLN